MRILDLKRDRALDKVYLGLQPEEVHQMMAELDQLLEHYEEPGYHCRLGDSEQKHEIRLAIYTEANLKHFDERARRLILEGK